MLGFYLRHSPLFKNFRKFLYIIVFNKFPQRESSKANITMFITNSLQLFITIHIRF